MIRRPSWRALAPVVLTVAVLVTGELSTAGATTLGAAAPERVATGSPDRSAPGRAVERLRADATGRVSLQRDSLGTVDFLGTGVGVEVRNPAVSIATSVSKAGRAHLGRYAAAFGLTRTGVTLTQQRVTHTASGTDVVSYAQRIGGLPVLGGDVVVSLRPDRQLASVLATTSRAATPAAARVSQTDAAAIARGVARRSVGGDPTGLTAVSAGRWIFDPAVFAGAAPGAGARSVWRFEVGDGDAVHRVVLVDDTTGVVLLNVDQIAHLDRVVCDNNNVQRTAVLPCTSGFARTEGGAAAAVADVNDAYDLGGATSDFYATLGIDLTALIGLDIGGTKTLASTVRFCYTTYACPYKNAFWNGSQMTYGQGYASADDVVGHEMTHGVTERTSHLFYWGQSGAINESLSDILGEIVDHRHPSPGDDTPSLAWALGEDLPGYPTGLRDLRDPTLHGQPDTMTSSNYTADSSGYKDAGGVHRNSGVGNKTAYLISQGGTFGGQTIIGIDGADKTLAKLARLYLTVDESLTSGSDYADLARVLDQSCQDLVTGHVGGFTSTNCANVHKAGLATQLATTPTNAAQPADAPLTCPTGSVRRILVNSEAGDPAALFSGTGGWLRGVNPYWKSNATSGLDDWSDAPTSSGPNPVPATTDTLTLTQPVTVPSGQPTYLWFQGWRLLSYDNPEFYDGGTVEVSDVAAGTPPADVADLPWINGPGTVLTSGYSNPAAGRKAFAGDSRGWTASRLDLSSFAGKQIRPQFSLNFSYDYRSPGWWVDDILLYTCDPSVVNAVKPSVSGSAIQGKTLTAKPGSWTPTGVSFAYRWLRNGAAIGGATKSTYKLTKADAGKRLSVRVAGTRSGFVSGVATSASTGAVKGLIAAGKPTITGMHRVGEKLTAHAHVRTGRVKVHFHWDRNGRPIPGATRSTYVLKPADRGQRIQVTVTGTRSGYVGVKSISAAVVPTG